MSGDWSQTQMAGVFGGLPCGGMVAPGVPTMTICIVECTTPTQQVGWRKVRTGPTEVVAPVSADP
ncbi:MAG: hypothetical protein ACYCU5_15530, partial [Actinomycetes bacterium]